MEMNKTLAIFTKEKISIAVEIAISFLLTILMFFFYQKMILAGPTASDVSMHVDFAKELPKIFTLGLREFISTTKLSHITVYPIWHILFSLVHVIIRDEAAAGGLLNALLVTANYLVLCYVLRKEIKSSWERTFAPLFALALTFAGPITLKIVNEQYYLGQFSYNLWHNPTTLAVKPLALYITYRYILLTRARDAEENIRLKEYVIIGLLLFLSAFAKPSFIQVFCPAVAIYCILYFVSNWKTGFMWGMKNAAMILPASLAIFAQNWLTGVKTGGVVISPFETWDYWTKNRLGSFAVSFAFILVTFMMLASEIEKTEWLSFTGLLFLVGFMEYSLLSFTNSPWIGDLEWGFSLTIGPAMLGGIVTVINQKKSYLQKAFAGVILLLQFAFGLIYWIKYFEIASFWVESFV